MIKQMVNELHLVLSEEETGRLHVLLSEISEETINKIFGEEGEEMNDFIDDIIDVLEE